MTANKNKFYFFKEITIGGIGKEQLLQKLSAGGIQFNQYAKVLCGHSQFIPSKETKKIQLVKATLSTLELEDTCSFQEFSTKALELGLKLCPLYLAAFLRLEYLDQPDGPYLTVVSRKPEKDESFPNGFYLRNYKNALWLRGYRADGFAGWPEENEFIFMK